MNFIRGKAKRDSMGICDEEHKEREMKFKTSRRMKIWVSSDLMKIYA